MKRNKWTDDRLELLHSYIGLFTAEATASLINAKTGSTFTEKSVQKAIQRYNIDPKLATGEMTINETARDVGISQQSAYSWLHRNGYKPNGKGKYRYVPWPAVEAMRAAFAKPQEEVVACRKAADELGYAAGALRWMVLRGQVRAVKYKGRLYVPRAEITRIKLDRLRAG